MRMVTARTAETLKSQISKISSTLYSKVQKTESEITFTSFWAHSCSLVCLLYTQYGAVRSFAQTNGRYGFIITVYFINIAEKAPVETNTALLRYSFGLRTGTSQASVRSLPCDLSSQSVAGASSDRRRSVRPAPLSNVG